MENNCHWVFSQRDNEMHDLEWGRKNPEKLKKEIIKLYEEIGETIDLKKEYPALFID